MSKRKRNRNFQNKLNQVKYKYLEDEKQKWKMKMEKSERNLQDMQVFEEFCHDVTMLPLYYYEKSLPPPNEKRSIETIIECLVKFFDDEVEEKYKKRVESVMDRYIKMYFPDQCIPYNKDLADLIEKAEEIKDMNFTVLKNILEHISDDDSWKLVAKHLKSDASDAKIEAQKTTLDKKCYVFINLVPNQVRLKDLCPELIFALSEYCECKVDIEKVKCNLDKAIAEQEAEYFA